MTNVGKYRCIAIATTFAHTKGINQCVCSFMQLYKNSHVLIYVNSCVLHQQRLPMKKILQYPFTKDCQWWAAVELITRLLLIIFIIVDVGNLVSDCATYQLILFIVISQMFIINSLCNTVNNFLAACSISCKHFQGQTSDT